MSNILFNSLKVFSGDIINSTYIFRVLYFNIFIFFEKGSHPIELEAFGILFISSFKASNFFLSSF